MTTLINKDNYRNLQPSEYNKFYANLIIGNKHGRCVYAGKDFKKGEIVEIAPFITETEFAYKDYVFNSSLPNTKYILVLGYGSLYNHSDTPNVGHELLNDKATTMEESYMAYYAEKDIKKGEELRISYGAHWFPSRGLTALAGGGKKYFLTKNKII